MPAANLPFDPEAALAELCAMQAELADAADTILGAAETILAGLDRAGTGAAELRQHCHAAIQACAFRDLVGQRIAKLSGWIDGEVAQDADPLLNGPATHGHGLDQAGADALFSQSPAPVPG